MTYNVFVVVFGAVFGGTLNLTQSVIMNKSIKCWITVISKQWRCIMLFIWLMGY